MIKVGQTEQKLGQTEREFTTAAENSFIQPLRRFLEGEMKTITREKGILESKRLDLDACKNRVRKARSMLGHQTVTVRFICFDRLIALIWGFARPFIVVDKCTARIGRKFQN